ncbi:adenylate/guanylate cyclase domain-containing protein [Marinivivus vitaminiproducens]|uniref:adenylate/guanylate cyclase domain-containing protein n=1 Tax=Marinivivus vitaminiproducens TaxID=3035935 RepID=UPI00279ED8BF|nr:adenylate/guanylate cyclase domain-containing protein [Geminicoccaceae bacterium SCSIO 64248]
MSDSAAGTEDATFRALLAAIRRDLTAPVDAIAGYSEILQDEALRQGLHGAIADIERIQAASRSLRAKVDDLLDPSGVTERAASPVGLEQQLRHDLRTPLNAIKGYSEMLLEDLPEDGLADDLRRLLQESDRLLDNIDRIVSISHSDSCEASADHDEATASLLRSRMHRAEREAPAPVVSAVILVVDDNASNRELLMRRLVREGHRTIEADSGSQCLEILQAQAVDLILLDLLMPDIDGFAVLERLKADPSWREIPVIMISGVRETASVLRCIEAGAEDYLPKPFDPILLRARINACLERKRWRDTEQLYLARLGDEKARYETLLHAILPGQIVARLSDGQTIIADRVEQATILFCDLVGFTEVAARTSPSRLVADLNRIFTAFDDLVRGFGVEKIKTVGDAYMAAAGLPEPRPDHVEVMAELGHAMLRALSALGPELAMPLNARVGIHSGPVVAGVIGQHRFIYDVWGDTVNVASRLEASGLPGRIHVSDEVRRTLSGLYRFEARGRLPIKGKGDMETAFLGLASA